MMGLVMLHDLFGSEVEHADCFIVSACEDALFSWMETSRGDRSLETIVFLDFFLFLHVPNQQSLILTSRTHQGHISIDLCAIDPIIMSQERSLELLSIDVPHLDTLIVTGRKQGLAIIEETNRFYCSRVTLDDLGLGVGARVPQSNGIIV